MCRRKTHCNLIQWTNCGGHSGQIIDLYVIFMLGAYWSAEFQPIKPAVWQDGASTLIRVRVKEELSWWSLWAMASINEEVSFQQRHSRTDLQTCLCTHGPSTTRTSDFHDVKLFGKCVTGFQTRVCVDPPPCCGPAELLRPSKQQLCLTPAVK